MLGAAARWPLLLVAISATLGAAKGDVGELEEEKLVEDEEVGDHGREICYNTDDQMDPILFFFFVLLVGAVILLGLARLPQHWPRPPYTAILFVIGMGMGGLADYDHLGKLGHATKGMTNMDPHLILYAFLPPLLFESAFSMSHHVFVKCLPQALVLALPGVLIATGLTGTIVRWIFVEYDWSWTLAMVFGAIVSATDPVAVVALLVELSAPKPLSTVIEAESLLNDGSAFVVFLLLLSFAAGDEKSVGEVVTTIVKLAVVGPLLGLAFGIGFNECLLRFCNNDPTIEISLLIIAAYICFWTAETTETEASGVLAVVTLGLYMGGPGKHTISPEIHHEMHHVWSFLGHAANTVLFVLSGSFSYFLVNSPTITATDWGYLLATYFVIHFTRGVTILVLWPALQSLGYGMSVPRGIILWYAGLRGAVGLVLALLVSHEEGISPENRTRIQFLVAGLVALTIGINGTTAGLLYKKLGLSESTKGYKATLKLSVDHVEKTTDKLAAEMKSFQFWGSLVQKDLTEEVRKLVEYRPHSAHGTEPAEEFCTDNERLKRKVVAWFGTQPEHAGRRIARVTYIREIGKMQFDAHYRHIVDYGWPPPLTGVGGATDLDAREECMRFTLDKAGNDVVSVGKGNRLEESKLYFTEGKVNKQAFHWYPDFSPVVASTPPSFLQRIFAKRQRQNHNRTLLSDIREDLRRIIIVSVQHRYDEWNERRIIKPDVHGILEEATLFVEDEDHMWVSQMEDMWEFRGRYDLKSEFIRVLEAIGLHEHGSLCIALRGMAATVEHEPYGEDATPSLTQKYWASRNDYLGRLLALLNRLAGKFMDSDGFTNAYLHNKLRLAVSCLMFYRAAHEEAWTDIQSMWGALLEGAKVDDESDDPMKEERDDLKWCYEQADQLLDAITKVLPGAKGIIASLYEDFIHRLLVVQMIASTATCMHHGLLIDGDAESMHKIIRSKLKPMSHNHMLGANASRIRDRVEQAVKERFTSRHRQPVVLPNWNDIERLMKETAHGSVIDKKMFWEITFVSRLQAMSSRSHHKDTETDQAYVFIGIDGERKSGSLDASSKSPFHQITLEKNKTMHLSVMSDGESDDSAIEIGDPVCLRHKFLQRCLTEKDKWNFTREFSSSLPSKHIKMISFAEQRNINRKGWVMNVRQNANANWKEALVYCTFVAESEEERLSWYPVRALQRCPGFLYEDLLKKEKKNAKKRLQWCIRQVWFRATVDRMRQSMQDRYPHLVSPYWMKAKMIHHEYVGTPYPWWGCTEEKAEVIYTDLTLPNDPTKPDWSRGEWNGVLLRSSLATHPGTAAVVRDRGSQRVLYIPQANYRDVSELELESHFGRLGLLPSSSFVPFIVGGTEFPTTDHYYQACKYPDIADEYREERHEYRRKIIEARTAAHATRLGQDKANGPPICPNWDAIRDEVMMRGIRAKFSLQHGLRRHHQQLLSTGLKRLYYKDQTETNFHRHWSVAYEGGKRVGENAYGRLLQLMRRELRVELITEPVIAACLCLLAKQVCSIRHLSFKLGDHVRVKMHELDDYSHGIVSQVIPESGVVLVLGEGCPEPRQWRFILPSLEVQRLCPNCGTFLKGVADSVSQCYKCHTTVRFPTVFSFSSYHNSQLSPAAETVPPIVDGDGSEYHSTDHYYQAAKFPPSELRTSIIEAPSSVKALELGQNRHCDPPMRSDWEHPAPQGDVPDAYVKIIEAKGEQFLVKTKTMVEAIRKKYCTVKDDGLSDHQKLLLKTGDDYLLLDDREDNLSAIYWGTGPNNTGLNMYGVLLMVARTELRENLAKQPKE